MILHWEQLILHYGPALGVHRARFAAASQTTYGLLCCRYSPTEDELGYSGGDHAEAHLLRSALWTTHLPNALRQWTPHDSRITVALVLNRSPCRNCAALLVDALGAMYRSFPDRGPRNRFILAARGAYEDAAMATRTTQNDLIRLRDAGWELCVLQVGPTLSARGRILLEGIERVAGHGFVRLNG
jgi:hypothetical protein